jgi:acylglycerol lipase
VLNYRYWAAPEAGDAAVYLHGIAGHSLWFSAAASHLAASGLTVYAPDRRGSGLNGRVGSAGGLDRRVVLQDIRHAVELAQAEHPGRKVFLLAGCWGAKPGVLFAAHEQTRLAGLVLIAPALSVRVKLPVVTLLGVVWSLLVDPERRFPIPLAPEQYTDNPRFRAFIAGDPQRLLDASARFYLETARLDRLAAAAPPAIRLPVLLLQGGRDRIVAAERVRGWFGRLASIDKTLKVYPDFAHILEFEEQRHAYLADLLAWLTAHGTGAGARRTALAAGV